MKKKKIAKDYPWEKNGDKFVKCDQENCDEEAHFKAPKSVNSLEKYNFCLEHVKVYNKRWDFFAGKSQDQIYDFLKNDLYQDKPTRPISEKVSSKINFEFNAFDEDFLKDNSTDKEKFQDNINVALDLFNIMPPFSSSQLKKKYNNLVKKNHPDLHDGDEKKENLLKKINIYYNILKKIAT